MWGVQETFPKTLLERMLFWILDFQLQFGDEEGEIEDSKDQVFKLSISYHPVK